MKRKQQNKSNYKAKTKGKPKGGAAKKAKLGDDAFDWGDGNAHVASDSELSGEDNGKDDKDEEEDPFANETADETRVRLAKSYLGKLQDKFQDNDDDDDQDRLAKQLEKDVAESDGKLFKLVADKLASFEFDEESSKFLKGHNVTVTCVCTSEDGRLIYSAAKDGSILKWSITSDGVTKTKFIAPVDEDNDNKKPTKAVPDHKKTVLALALSSDNKYLASGGVDKILRVWNGESNECIESFKGHRDAISSLAFRTKAHMLFSGSFDRTVKHWNLTEMGYIETLFGHQNEITAVDCLQKDRVVSVGRDASVRLWKIPEETQLVFHGTGSIDCLAMINDEYYVTGDDSGSLVLWFNAKKKPTFTQRAAHGGAWITSVAVLPRTDLIASGSSDGFVRLWKANLKVRSLEAVGAVPVGEGFVNSLAFPKDGGFLVAGVGKEHRLGRWDVKKQGKNGVVLIALPSLDEDDDA
ncbi:unnamed protein product [Aphanomyces euteiches]|uniref:Uncharacterized protein n=1 Tax=Aphanomyces euteiches TaxID=100861 RepID=A0A6G0XP95_9STRA|nr:hypothetical protein Ae201684_002736 [Aphanomyces euteiches]KAH9092538.1 hypothetical protein Ae201684P_008213 [Aphanomyces euteiches]KAH9131884.1 hypothetical protein AeRB84_021599 [Aphanomyces euteiches]